jgi:FkbM family methyltransferase
LSWDTAISIVGHDIEIKQTYKALIESAECRPDLFLDIGANYGTHSLLFLACGIPTLTFEPNSSCHAYFLHACATNKVAPHIEHIALGAEKGEVRLVYPKRETWLGSTNAHVIAELEKEAELVTETVQQSPLDDYLSRMKSNRVLIKIDTEGNELSVLKGAEAVLREVRPRIIFESREESERAALFDFFEARGYELFALPWSPRTPRKPLTREGLCSHSEDNFMAAPR